MDKIAISFTVHSFLSNQRSNETQKCKALPTHGLQFENLITLT